MTPQSCKTCDFFTLDSDPVRIDAGWCWWASRHPVPSCYSQAESETWEGAGEICPCWRTKGYIETYLAGVRARRAVGPVT